MGKRRKHWRLGRRLLKAVAGAVIVSVVWVLVYAVLPVPATVPMIGDWLAGTDVRRDWTPLSRIDPDLQRAVIAGEDAKFCMHHGFDTEAIERALKNNGAGRHLRGASTISQQTAKNAFLWPARSWLRKGLEAYFTGLIELVWSKRRIMEVYLNVAEFGTGVYGAEAAARHYYGKGARVLTAREAAQLAAILPSPIRRTARSPRGYTRTYARRIERWIRIVDADGQDACLGL